MVLASLPYYYDHPTNRRVSIGRRSSGAIPHVLTIGGDDDGDVEFAHVSLVGSSISFSTIIRQSNSLAIRGIIWYI